MTGRRQAVVAIVPTVAAMLGTAVAGALIAQVAPTLLRSLGPTTAGLLNQPHPVLTGVPSEVVEILLTNLPPLLALLLAARMAWGRFGMWRLPADLIAGVVATGTTFRVGAALGLHGASLLPYLPHLPLELAAVMVTVSAWIVARTRPVPAGRLATLVAVLAIVAALVEVYATPHRPPLATSPFAAGAPAGRGRPVEFRTPCGGACDRPNGPAPGGARHRRHPAMTVTAPAPETLTIDEAIERLDAVPEPATARLSQLFPDRNARDVALRAMTREQRVELFWANGMTLDDACRWNVLFPGEMPLINGELAVHMVNAPEVCERHEARP